MINSFPEGQTNHACNALLPKGRAAPAKSPQPSTALTVVARDDESMEHIMQIKCKRSKFAELK